MARKRVGSITAKKIGDWNGAIRFLGELGHLVEPTAKTAINKEAEGLKTRILAHIFAQDLPWAPLSPNTIKRKKGPTKNKIYLDTTTYIDAIRVWREGSFTTVGIRKGTTYRNRKDRSVTVDQVAIWMEFGTRKAPARPLWNPSINEAGGARGIRDRVARALFNKIKQKARGKPVTITYKDIRSLVR